MGQFTDTMYCILPACATCTVLVQMQSIAILPLLSICSGRHFHFFGEVDSALRNAIYIRARCIVGEHHAHTAIFTHYRFAKEADIGFGLAQHFFHAGKHRLAAFLIRQYYCAGAIALMGNFGNGQAQHRACMQFKIRYFPLFLCCILLLHYTSSLNMANRNLVYTAGRQLPCRFW
jgi:hypothetical protein